MWCKQAQADKTYNPIPRAAEKDRARRDATTIFLICVTHLFTIKATYLFI